MIKQTLLFIFLALTLIFASAAPTGAEVYSFTQLPYIGETYNVPSAYLQAWVTAINDLGQVVGVDQTAISKVPRAFVWSENEGMQYVETTIQPYGLWFSDINNNGEVVGDALYIPIYWSKESGSIQLEEPDDCMLGSAWGMNDQGQMVGHTCASDCGTVSEKWRAVLWDALGVPQLLPLPSGMTQSYAAQINNKGDVVGACYNQGRVDDRAFLWQKKGGMRILVPLQGDAWSRGLDINAKGDVVGVSHGSSSGTRAVLWPKNGSVQVLGSLPGLTSSTALAINNSGRIVGVAGPFNSTRRPFIWTKAKGMKDLNNLVQGLPAGVTLYEAYDINNEGQIIVWGLNANTSKSVHGVLTPITE